MIARHIPNNEVVLVAEAGHSSYGERADYFNRKMLDFIRRHPREQPTKYSS